MAKQIYKSISAKKHLAKGHAGRTPGKTFGSLFLSGILAVCGILALIGAASHGNTGNHMVQESSGTIQSTGYHIGYRSDMIGWFTVENSEKEFIIYDLLLCEKWSSALAAGQSVNFLYNIQPNKSGQYKVYELSVAGHLVVSYEEYLSASNTSYLVFTVVGWLLVCAGITGIILSFVRAIKFRFTHPASLSR